MKTSDIHERYIKFRFAHFIQRPCLQHWCAKQSFTQQCLYKVYHQKLRFCGKLCISTGIIRRIFITTFVPINLYPALTFYKL